MYIYKDEPDIVNLPGLSEQLLGIAKDRSLDTLHREGELDAISLPTMDNRVLIGTRMGYLLLVPESALQNLEEDPTEEDPSDVAMRPSTGFAEFDY